jgi:rhodanese-related sulfurtransferase
MHHLILAVALLLSACKQGELPGAPLATASASDLLAKGAIALDVRTPEEFQSGHYAGALNIPVDQLESRLNELPDKSIPIVAYCASGARSGHAAQILKAAGYTEVINAGGLRDMPVR